LEKKVGQFLKWVIIIDVRNCRRAEIADNKRITEFKSPQGPFFKKGAVACELHLSDPWRCTNYGKSGDH
jgi:hypothetical protein